MQNSNNIKQDCPFCDKRRESVPLWTPSISSYVTEDKYPVTPGHMLVVPMYHASNFLELPTAQQRDMFDTAVSLAEHLRDSDDTITGFNIGINIGAAAGQTVDHAHIHVIPRREGDTPNPRGGIRGVIQGKADYNDRE